MTTRFQHDLVDAASLPFRGGGRFAYHYARGKLSSDCIFREVLKRGIFPPEARFLDLGCGQGSLFAWLLAARKFHEQGRWPGDWAIPPNPLSLRGIELMEKDVGRAVRAFGANHPLVSIRQGDMCEVDLGEADVVTILDALHYIDHARQNDLLGRIRAALPGGGLFLTRVGDAGAGLPYHICNWVDRAVTLVRGHRLPRLYGRQLAHWIELLKGHGFQVEAIPMSQGKPFANIMLISRVPA